MVSRVCASLSLVSLVVSLFGATPAHAQGAALFGSGRPPEFRPTDADRRFLRTRLYQVLTTGHPDPGCVQLLGALFTVLGEAAPLFHDRDEQFVLDPTLINALQSQMSTELFPAQTFFTLMARRIRMDKRMRLEWLQTAAAVNATVQTIDLGKLRMIATEVQPITSAYFSMPVFRERFQAEVERANSASAASALNEFKEAYLDHTVAFGALTLIDLVIPEAEKNAPSPLGPLVVADWLPPDPNQLVLSLEPRKQRVKVRVKARLAPKQYLDLGRVPKGHRILLRGRFWGVNATGTEVELRDALLFEDRDWGQGTLLANPAAVASCPAAINDLQGLSGPSPFINTK